MSKKPKPQNYSPQRAQRAQRLIIQKIKYEISERLFSWF
jgi:hypothetical protein